MGQSIQEWTKWNLWKTAFKKSGISLAPFLNILLNINIAWCSSLTFNYSLWTLKLIIWICIKKYWFNKNTMKLRRQKAPLALAPLKSQLERIE